MGRAAVSLHFPPHPEISPRSHASPEQCTPHRNWTALEERLHRDTLFTTFPGKVFLTRAFLTVTLTVAWLPPSPHFPIPPFRCVPNLGVEVDPAGAQAGQEGVQGLGGLLRAGLDVDEEDALVGHPQPRQACQGRLLAVVRDCPHSPAWGEAWADLLVAIPEVPHKGAGVRPSLGVVTDEVGATRASTHTHSKRGRRGGGTRVLRSDKITCITSVCFSITVLLAVRGGLFLTTHGEGEGGEGHCRHIQQGREGG